MKYWPQGAGPICWSERRALTFKIRPSEEERRAAQSAPGTARPRRGAPAGNSRNGRGIHRTFQARDQCYLRGLDDLQCGIRWCAHGNGESSDLPPPPTGVRGRRRRLPAGAPRRKDEWISMVWHDSWDSADRAPFGAVAAGTPVSLRLRLSRALGTREVSVVLFYDDDRRHPLRWMLPSCPTCSARLRATTPFS